MFSNVIFQRIIWIIIKKYRNRKSDWVGSSFEWDALIDSFEEVEGLGPTLLWLAYETWFFFYDYFSKYRLILGHGLYPKKYGISLQLDSSIECHVISKQNNQSSAAYQYLYVQFTKIVNAFFELSTN